MQIQFGQVYKFKDVMANSDNRTFYNRFDDGSAFREGDDVFVVTNANPDKQQQHTDYNTLHSALENLGYGYYGQQCLDDDASAALTRQVNRATAAGLVGTGACDAGGDVLEFTAEGYGFVSPGGGMRQY